MNNTAIERVGFIGLGNIGKPMATHLLKGDFETLVYDVFAESAESLVKQGAKFSSIAEMAEHCQFIGICVRDDNDVYQVFEQLLPAAKACKVVAIHSTVKPETIKTLAEQAAAQHIAVLDAPISGGSTGAAEGTLCYMVGGDEAALDYCRPVLELSAKSIIHAGDLGQGMIAKLCNNLVTYAQFTAIYEALRLAKAAGLSTDIVKEVGQLNGNLTQQMSQFLGLHEFKPHFSPEDFEKFAGGFAAVAEKDLTIALEQAEKFNQKLPSCEKSLELIGKVYRDAY